MISISIYLTKQVWESKCQLTSAITTTSSETNEYNEIQNEDLTWITITD